MQVCRAAKRAAVRWGRGRESRRLRIKEVAKDGRRSSPGSTPAYLETSD